MMPSKLAYQAQLFSNRLAKKYRTLRKWARKHRVSCYRLYDRDIPEVPLAADLYEFLPDDIRDKGAAARHILASEPEVCTSIAALWEIGIKKSIGKLRVPFSLAELADCCWSQRIMILPISSRAHRCAGATPEHSRRPVRPAADCAGMDRRSDHRHKR